MNWVAAQFFEGSPQVIKEWSSFWHPEAEQQRILDGFSENTISNFPFPFGIAPNFIINGKAYAVPMVIEESSVVAAASSAAKFWMDRGGFQAKVLGMTKIGQVHFLWTGAPEVLFEHFETIQSKLLTDSKYLTARMEARGGGIKAIELLDFTAQEANYFQLKVSFDTKDSMGANFINSVLEQFATSLLEWHQSTKDSQDGLLTVVMAILSNYTPACLVQAKVSCPIQALEGACPGMSGHIFAEKFYTAVRIAHIDPYRATTHNKGIYNGIDAVVLATANDFRAVEACGHTFAARDGQYRSLSSCTIDNQQFTFELEVPMAIGTVGGLTKLHPLAHRALELLGNPSAETLMEIIASVGLAQNFAAIKSLITTGIQRGHMKMHLQNMLYHLEAKNGEMEATLAYFEDKPVSFNSVREFLAAMRKEKE